MNHSTIAMGWYALIIAAILTFPAQAQERIRQEISTEPSAGIPTGNQGGQSVPAAPAAGSQGMSSSGPASFNSGGSPGAGWLSPSQPVSNFPPIPKLSGTSFESSDSYLKWEIYSDYMLRHFMMDPYYFNRFYRNAEPLITPELLKLSTAEPLKASAMMLSSVNELQKLIAALKTGEPVSKKEITSKLQAIRKLAGNIRKDQLLLFIDQRKKIDILKGQDPENLGLSAISQLCEIATELHSQLAGLNRQTTTSTISVYTLTQPSIESLSSGIEKLTKVIEDSAKGI